MIMLLIFIMYIYLAHLDHENVLVGRISVNVWLVDHEDIVLVPGELAAGQLQDVSSLTLHTQTHSSQILPRSHQNTKKILILFSVLRIGKDFYGSGYEFEFYLSGNSGSILPNN
jgi:hypothetical protein